MTRIRRRTFVGLSLASGFGLVGGAARALGRTPVGGTLRLSVPFGIGELDPHAGNDPLAALFASAVSDPLYALDSAGKPYPALAATLPEASPDGTKARVVLRSGLRTAAGRRIDAIDVVRSLERARKSGGAAVLAEFGKPAVVRGQPLALFVPTTDAARLALALASPLTAIVPNGFSPLSPDGTGAFRATLRRGELVLTRNVNASRGASFLERIEVRAARDLADALRAFESDLADMGWLGSGLHRPRAGALPFTGPDLGWVVLRTGRAAGAWGAPGIAEQLLDRVPADRLRPLGITPPQRSSAAGAAWGGAAAELIVSDDAPQLGEIAEALAPLLSRPAHPVRARRIPRSDIVRRRNDGSFALLLDFVRSVGPPGRATQLALLAAVDPELAARPPQRSSFDAVEIARGLPLGVVGVLRVSGARLPDSNGLESWQLGSVFRTPR